MLDQNGHPALQSSYRPWSAQTVSTATPLVVTASCYGSTGQIAVPPFTLTTKFVGYDYSPTVLKPFN
jgi:hypothetical protein